MRQISLVGAVDEEVGDYFPEFLGMLEESPFLKVSHILFIINYYYYYVSQVIIFSYISPVLWGECTDHLLLLFVLSTKLNIHFCLHQNIRFHYVLIFDSRNLNKTQLGFLSTVWGMV